MYPIDPTVEQNTPVLMKCITPQFSEAAKEDDPSGMDELDND
jgi:hypothetical protein